MSNLPAALGPDQVRFVAPDDGLQIDVRIDNETVWLTQAQIAELFGRAQQASRIMFAMCSPMESWKGEAILKK